MVAGARLAVSEDARFVAGRVNPVSSGPERSRHTRKTATRLHSRSLLPPSYHQSDSQFCNVTAALLLDCHRHGGRAIRLRCALRTGCSGVTGHVSCDAGRPYSGYEEEGDAHGDGVCTIQLWVLDWRAGRRRFGGSGERQVPVWAAAGGLL